MIELTTQRIPEEAQPQRTHDLPLESPRLVKMVRLPSIKFYQVHQFPANGCTDRLSYMLVRPPKITYDERLLVPPLRDTRFLYRVEKVPFDLSIYTPIGHTPEYFLLYLHGNSSSRLEGSSLLRMLPMNAALACFDFESCGNRTGQWITLGLKQAKEVDIAVEHIQTKLGLPVVLWGRSMGAVSALMSNKAKVMVVDSAFSSLKMVCLETAKNNSPYVPNCLIDCLFPCVYSILRNDIEKKTGHNIDELDVAKKVEQMSTDYSLLFLTGEQDEMVHASHSKLLYEKFRGNKQKFWFDGTHNSTRSDALIKQCFAWIQKNLKLDPLREPSQAKQVEPSEIFLSHKSGLAKQPLTQEVVSQPAE